MILDELLEFADASDTIQASAGRALLGDVVDLGATPQDYGLGEPMYLVIQVDEAIDSAGDAATVQFIVASDAQAAIATDGSASEHAATEVFAEATLVAGFRQTIPLPIGDGVPYERYLGVLALIGTEAVTGGTVSAFLTKDPSRWRSYPDGQN
jgi:hypothetical protein